MNDEKILKKSEGENSNFDQVQVQLCHTSSHSNRISFCLFMFDFLHFGILSISGLCSFLSIILFGPFLSDFVQHCLHLSNFVQLCSTRTLFNFFQLCPISSTLSYIVKLQLVSKSFILKKDYHQLISNRLQGVLQK